MILDISDRIFFFLITKQKLLEIFIFKHLFNFLIFYGQATRPILFKCDDLEGILDKTVCGVNLPVFRRGSAVSHTALSLSFKCGNFSNVLTFTCIAKKKVILSFFLQRQHFQFFSISWLTLSGMTQFQLLLLETGTDIKQSYHNRTKPNIVSV